MASLLDPLIVPEVRESGQWAAMKSKASFFLVSGSLSPFDNNRSSFGVYTLSLKFTLNWLVWSGLVAGIGLIFFSIAWGVGAVLEGVPRAGSMGILLFGLPGLIVITVTLKKITSQQEITR